MHPDIRLLICAVEGYLNQSVVAYKLSLEVQVSMATEIKMYISSRNRQLWIEGISFTKTISKKYSRTMITHLTEIEIKWSFHHLSGRYFLALTHSSLFDAYHLGDRCHF